MAKGPSHPIVHLELHTGDLARACDFYAEVCGWSRERIVAGGRSYWALGLGGDFGGGVVECETPRPVWLPYVEVQDIAEITERARGLGASVLLEPREGPAGWRSVIATRASGEVALWQPKEWRRQLRKGE
jgi:predicted enzyme related to lactoylglutathione lyase